MTALERFPGPAKPLFLHRKPWLFRFPGNKWIKSFPDLWEYESELLFRTKYQQKMRAREEEQARAGALPCGNQIFNTTSI